jgi:hypothetical protein
MRGAPAAKAVLAHSSNPEREFDGDAQVHFQAPAPDAAMVAPQEESLEDRRRRLLLWEVASSCRLEGGAAVLDPRQDENLHKASHCERRA